MRSSYCRRNTSQLDFVSFGKPKLMDSITILLEEPSYLVVNKPPGLFTQAASGIESVETQLRSLLSSRPNAPHQPFIGLPHRLDRGTSGILLIARNQRALKRFCSQFESRIVRKLYLAVFENTLETDEGTWVDWMRKIPERAQAEIVPSEHPEAKKAVLHFKVLAKSKDQSLVQIELETGRMHQIRLQTATRGFPIVGDDLYGSCQSWDEQNLEGGKKSVALHAWKLEFRHPLSAVITKVAATVPASWNQLHAEWQEIIRHSS
jgi:23S rRNA pseudouridine1911/1915/1917 synthase